MTAIEYSESTTTSEIVKAFPDKVNGRTFLVTGASEKSVGSETAISLARDASPAIIILPGRTYSRIEPVIKEINNINPAVKTIFVELDLSDPASVKKAAGEILDSTDIDHIDVLINSAGVMVTPYTPTNWKSPTGQPIELQFGTNHLGHFLLTKSLLPKIRKAAPGARIVSVSSSAHRLSGIRYDDPGFQNGETYTAWEAYGQSKTANILLANFLGHTIPKHEIASFSLHPGSISSGLQQYVTPEILQEGLARAKDIPNFEPYGRRKTLQEGAATSIRAALDPSLEAFSGKYLNDCNIYTPAPWADSFEEAEKLWKWSEECVERTFAN
ncbi:NAD-P-binding protein [Talaromyces proteolyticus]|uniref:NAD-P-binding protein n=1 Tax=Talaromyces proteolyticus TaxID=1131652 RepID=A0AAD4PW29_9EURO|nr:NAD-P-binding protein [Talaromyces proteolyticus]KAH8697395.1 NAD-P-binding protein [Talaromyces proteolyticus]